MDMLSIETVMMTYHHSSLARGNSLGNPYGLWHPTLKTRKPPAESAESALLRLILKVKTQRCQAENDD